MVRKTVALNVDRNVYDRYQKYCKKHFYVLSRKIEDFMRKELEEETDNA